MVRLLNNYTVVCKTENGEELCSCDFRINIYDCPHSGFYVIAGKILLPICVLVAIMAGGFLIYLLKIKKQPFFLSASRERGWLRPRPMHSYHLLTFNFMAFQAFHLMMLINEFYPSIVAAEFFNIMINVATGSFAVFYTVSIVYSTPNIKLDDELFNRSGGPNTKLVDTVGIVLFAQPIVTWIPLAIIGGHYAEIEDYHAANVVFTIHYLSMVVWEIGYVVAIAYFWYKLMTIIKNYIKLSQERNLSGSVENNHKENIKKGTRNITLPVMAMIGGLSFQAVVYTVMSLTHRNITIFYFGWNVFYYWATFISFPLLGLLVESFLIYYTMTNTRKSPNSSNNSSKPSSSSQTTQVNSGQTINNTESKFDKNDNDNNYIGKILCCKPIINFDDTADTADTANTSNSPSSVVIHYTSETNTVVETVEENTVRNSLI